MSQPGSARAAAVLAPELADSGGVNGTAGFDPEGGGYAGAEGGAAAAYDGYAAGGYPAEGAEGGAYEAQQEQQEQQLEQQYKAADGGAGGAVAAEGAEGEYSPAAYLQQLHAHLGSLQGQRQELQQQLAGAAAAAYQQMSARLDTAGSGAPLPSGLPALAEELVVLQSVRQYLAYVQVRSRCPYGGALGLAFCGPARWLGSNSEGPGSLLGTRACPPTAQPCPPCRSCKP